MSKSSLAALALISFLLLSLPVQADTVGVKPGTSLSFNYDIITTYGTSNGNVTSETTANFLIGVTSVNTTGAVGQFGYTESVNTLNGTTESSTTPATNYTTIFNPFNNDTYFGNLGFWALIDTSVQTGARTGMVLSHSYSYYNGSTYTNYNADVLANVSVVRDRGLIEMNLSEIPDTANYTKLPVITRAKFNATTGVLISYTEYANIYSIVEKIFYYNLVSFSEPATPASYLWVAYVVVGLVAAIAVVQVARRKPKEARKRARVKEKFTHPS